MLNNIFYLKILALALLGAVILSSCATGPQEALRHKVRSTEGGCRTYDCFMKILGDNKLERSLDEDGNQVIRWYMSVTKTRPLEYGEEPRSGMYYRYYDEDCWFTAVFDPEGNVLTTDWIGPGCWGRGN